MGEQAKQEQETADEKLRREIEELFEEQQDVGGGGRRIDRSHGRLN